MSSTTYYADPPSTAAATTPDKGPASISEPSLASIGDECAQAVIPHIEGVSDSVDAMIMIRQSIEERAPLPKPRGTRDAELAAQTFANVPFEEHKIKRGGAAGAGGSQTRWYS